MFLKALFLVAMKIDGHNKIKDRGYMETSSFYVARGTWQNRVYFGTQGMTAKEIRQINSDKAGVLQRGAGIRSYGNFWGAILAWFGFAVKLRIGKNEIYVNTNSYIQWKLRSVQLVSKNADEHVRRIHALYMMAQQKGYLSLPFILQKGDFSNSEFLPNCLKSDSVKFALEKRSSYAEISKMSTIDQDAAVHLFESVISPYMNSKRKDGCVLRFKALLKEAMTPIQKEAAMRYCESEIGRVINGENARAAMSQLEQLFKPLVSNEQIKQAKEHYEQLLTKLKTAAQKDYRNNGFVIID